jgi:hypothetical protein
MTDPGDLANTDANTRDDMDQTKQVKPGVGEDNREEVLQSNDRDEGKMSSGTPDPLDL